MTVVTAAGDHPIPRASKAAIASAILDSVESLQSHGGEPMSESPEERGERVYDLYKRGSELLERGDFAAATIPLEHARSLEPDKTSIREALGRAYFRSGRFGRAAEEFEAVVERAPVNDFAHFCLGKALVEDRPRPRGAPPPTLAAGMRPDRADYRDLTATA